MSAVFDCGTGLLGQSRDYLSIGLDEGPPPAGVDFVTTVRTEFDPETREKDE
jgi:hypothetical protein